jgi:hypothetical protein
MAMHSAMAGSTFYHSLVRARVEGASPLQLSTTCTHRIPVYIYIEYMCIKKQFFFFFNI